MIYFFFRNKSKKYSKMPTLEMSYLINIYKIDITIIGIKSVEKHIALINSFIASVDMLIFYYMDSIILKLLIMFGVTILLVFVFYTFLSKFYKKLIRRYM